MALENKKWLVKSNSSVVGPYHFDEVVESIFKGDIHVLDEIKGPFERWRPIRDHSLFAAAIEKLKATTYQRRENTITENIDAFTQTGTMELTQTETDVMGSDSQTNTITMTGDITQSGRVSQAPPPSMPSQSSGAHEPPPPIQIKRRQSSRFHLAFIVSILVIVVGTVVLKFGELGDSTPSGSEGAKLFDEYTDKGLALLKVGEYKEALKYFNQAYDINPKDPNLILEMAPLLIQVDGQYGKVATMVETMIASNVQKEFLKRGKNIVGMSYSYRKQNSEALTEIDKSLEVDGQFYSALLNKGYLQSKVNRGQLSIETLLRAVQNSPNEAIGYYLLTRAYVEEGIKRQNPKMFSEALSISKRFSQKFFDFRQEVLFFIAIAKQNLGVERAELTRSVRNFLSLDPELTNLHVHQASWDFQSFQWGELIQHCEALATQLGQYNSQLLRGFCQYKSGKHLKAKSTFENLLSQNGKDGVLRSLYTASLFALNDKERAKNSIKFLSKVERARPLAEVLLRGCLQTSDMACVQRVIRSGPGSRATLLYSYWSMTELNREVKKQEARKSLTQGLSLSPYFGPLLKMRGQL